MPELRDLETNILIKGALDLPDSASNKKVSDSVLASDVPLSFWGGIDPLNGVVIDKLHPLVGQCVTDKVLCIPSGRGSCTASQVLLELILNDKAPRAIILRDLDPLVCVGAIIAEEVFDMHNLTILQVPEYQCFLEAVRVDGDSTMRLSELQLLKPAKDESPSSSSSSSSHSNDSRLALTHQEHNWLDNAASEAERIALRVIYRYARITGTKDYVPVSKAHIASEDGCTYIGPGGLEFVQRLVQAGGKVKIPTTLNSISTDRRRWKELSVPEAYAKAANALADAYLELNCQATFTCAPYLLLDKDEPTVGQDWVWGESNAVVYANSVLGAHTNKVADYLDICGALAGIVPFEGMHCAENRKPTIVLDATGLTGHDKLGDAFWPTLGHLCGSLSDGQVPLLIGLEDWEMNSDNFKSFCAAFGTTGSSPLIHVAGLTPEALDVSEIQSWINKENAKVVVVAEKDLMDTFRLLDKDTGSTKIDLIALGNPHLSVSECRHLVELVGRHQTKKRSDVRIIACISRAIQQAASEHISTLQDFGVEFVSDTCWCMLLDPPVIPASREAVILTNSGKYAHYGPGLVQRRFRFGSLADCIQTATTGVYSPQIGHARRSFHTATRYRSLAFHRIFRLFKCSTSR